MEDTGFSLEGRVLCSDGACIGVVGADRRCKTCGKIYDGDEPIDEIRDSAGPAPQADEPPAAQADEPVASESGSEAPDPSDRILCPDDTCIGIIGSDGRCGTCGKTA